MAFIFERTVIVLFVLHLLKQSQLPLQKLIIWTHEWRWSIRTQVSETVEEAVVTKKICDKTFLEDDAITFKMRIASPFPYFSR